MPLAALVSVTGAIAALGDTLFPAASLAQGFHQDFSGAANFLLRLRVVASGVGDSGGLLFRRCVRRCPAIEPAPVARRLAIGVLILALVQLSAGAINLLLLAPVWMQITHLLLADLVWISLVLLAVEAKLQ